MSKVFVSYKHVSPDQELADHLARHLEGRGASVFLDTRMPAGTEWAQEIERRIREADFFLVLLSGESIRSDMVRREVEIAYQVTRTPGRTLMIIPIRIGFTGELPYDLGAYLNRLQFILWSAGETFEAVRDGVTAALEQRAHVPAAGDGGAHHTSEAGLRKLTEITETIGAPLPSADHRIESETGSVRPGSPFYIERKADAQLRRQVSAAGTTTIVKGARQMGKSSLLARAYAASRHKGQNSFYLDFQLAGRDKMETLENLALYLAHRFARELRTRVRPEATWDNFLGAMENLTNFLEEAVLSEAQTAVLVLLDEVDSLFNFPYYEQFFAAVRVWHNRRAVREEWNRLNLVIAHSTEPYLWIKNLNQSPFNVGYQIKLDDFSPQQVSELNERYGGVLREGGDLEKLMELLGGHPYLTRQALFTLASGALDVDGLLKAAADDDGPFGDHLRRYVLMLQGSPEMLKVLADALRRRECESEADFLRLRGAGLVKGETRHSLQIRCRLYEEYFRKHL